MPGLTGLEVLSRLRSDRCEIPVIVMTGSDDVNLARRTIEAGARALLRKPVLAGHVLAVLKAVLGRAH
jgi:FixJ family two-component response regulator